MAIRPRTLGVAVAPVVAGTALAWHDDALRAGAALAALAGALFITIGTNLANDLFDCERGTDGPDRVGPPRAAALGLLTPAALRRGIAASFGVALIPGIYLVSVAFWPIGLVGVASILAGLAYTGGPFPYGYRALGDLVVFVFFGIVAVAGTYYVQALTLTPPAFLVALPIGALATAILVVNNIRDRETDLRAGKRTLAVLLGDRGARLEYVFLIVLGFAAIGLLRGADVGGGSLALFLPFLLTPIALRLVHTVWTQRDAAVLNRALAQTAGLLLGFSVLLSIGIAW